MNADTNKLLKKSFRQRGLTLIELAVVLLVLVGLAGLLLPYAGGFIGKTHHATSADAGNSLASSLLQYQALKGAYPQNMEALTSNGTLMATDLDDNYWTSADGTRSGTTGSNFALLPTNSSIQLSLQAAGILKVAYNQAGSQSTATDGTPTNGINPTFATATLNNTITAAAPTQWVTSGTNGTHDGGLTIYKLFYPSLGNTVGLPAGKNVIVFGIGQDTTAIGVTLSSAPVYFSDKAVANPSVTYGRFLAAFLVDNTGTSPAPAQLLGIVHAADTTDGWQNLSSNIAGFAK
jgi:type II secretory pathway pseudopilin PulG